MNDEIESKFAELYVPFETHKIYSENKTSRGRTFSGQYLQARYEATLELISFVEKNSSILLTSPDPRVREKAEKTLSRPNLLIKNPDKNIEEMWAWSARKDIEALSSRSFKYFFSHHVRGPRFVCLTENIYNYIKQQLEKRHWEVGPYFKDVKSFAKYVKTREQDLREQSLSEQDKQDIQNSIADIHINSSGTGLRQL